LLVNTKLVVYLRAMVLANPKQYKDLATKMVLLIDKNNSIVKSRRSNLN